VTIQEVNDKVARQMGIPEHTGVLVADVVNGSPADEAGVDLGDVIVKVNGREVKDPGDFVKRIQEAGVGSTVALEVNRAGTKEEIKVTLEAARAWAWG
jgi:serine protease Do